MCLSHLGTALYSLLRKFQLFTLSTTILQFSQVLTFTAKAAVKTLYSIRITYDMTEAVHFLEKHNS
jgi:hypothetical protein